MLAIQFLFVIATIIDVVILGYCPFESLRSRLVEILLRPAGCSRRWVSKSSWLSFIPTSQLIHFVKLEIVPRRKHFVCRAWDRTMSFYVTLRR
ncbi:hypothetical protein DFJ43DRAFT_1079296 [Lentinula guzmanii]|uniref:Uncharacterized protein n=1 Tax=Lentinula guzmanii TaxID=2804957 RepID=A0AA38JHV3_9AGAR|nr:hypothetical protein DFJ43DRAFT_1079296 [Lentinula guzmanii]